MLAQSNASTYHTRQAHKEGLIQKGRDETVKDMIMGSIQNAFTSTDPKMVELRSQMFRQAGVLLPQVEVAIQGQMVPSTGGVPRYLVDDIVKRTPYTLMVPFGMAQRKKEVASGIALLSTYH
jgi:hypothetical protein